MHPQPGRRADPRLCLHRHLLHGKGRVPETQDDRANRRDRFVTERLTLHELNDLVQYHLLCGRYSAGLYPAGRRLRDLSLRDQRSVH
mgnify:CR=1 FL=1